MKTDDYYARVGANLIAQQRRKESHVRWADVFKRVHDPEKDKPINYGFTFICNECGSMKVSVCTVYHGFEGYSTTMLKCENNHRDEIA